MAPMREWTVRPNFRSPQQPITRLSSRPFSRLMVSRSVRVWVGWWWPPSPALITGTVAFMEATKGAPSLGWRMAMMSAKQLTVRAVSATLSPLAAEELWASEKPRTWPPSSYMADSKLRRVRVEGS